MKRVLVSVICALTLAGCAGQFNVRQADDRFSENKNPVFLSENNRISTKSVAGGIHIDDRGVYINPFVEKNKATNQVVALGFRITNLTEYNTLFGAPNQLGSLSEVVFRLKDGQLITLQVVKAEERADGPAYYNSVGGFASIAKQESGIVLIPKEQYEKLISSSAISCRITGSKRNAVYEEGDISGSFLENLRQFYQGYVK